MVGVAPSARWGYVRIITGTILGGVFGFYFMHRLEISYKEKMNQQLKKYEAEMKMKQQVLNELEDSVLDETVAGISAVVWKLLCY